MQEYKESKHSKKKGFIVSDETKQRLLKILNTPEVYDFNKVRKPIRTMQTDELNFYIPEKWVR